MEIQDRNTLITDETVNTYIRKYKDDDRFKKSLIEIMTMLIKNYDNMVLNHRRDMEEGQMLCYLREMEKRMQEGSSRIGDTIKSEMKDVKECSSRLGDQYTTLKLDMIEEIRNVKDVVRLEGSSRLGDTIQGQYNSLRSDVIEEVRNVKDVVKQEGSSKLVDTIQGHYNSLRSEIIDVKETVRLEGSSKLGDTIQGHYNSLRSDMIEDRKQLIGIEDRIKESLSEKMIGFVLNIKDVVSTSLDRLNVESLRESMGSQFDLIRKETKVDIQEIMQSYKIEVTNEVKKSTTEIMKRNEEILEEVRNIKIEDSEIYEKIKTNTIDTITKLSDKLSMIEKDVNEKLMKTVSMINESKEVSNVQYTFLLSEMQRVPKLIKGALSDTLHRVEQIEQDVKTVLQDNPKMKMIQSENDKMMLKLDDISCHLLSKGIKEENNSSVKGSEGEKRLLDGLSEQLMCRDGYRIENVSGQSHECDLIVKREGYRSIRIESKAYKDKVRTSEVDKFCRDLLECEDHGIFVSLHSGIVGRCNNEIQQLASGRIAVYLTNNNYNIENIISVIYMIYILDDVIDKNKEEVDGIVISQECFQKIREKIAETNNYMTQATTKLKESLQFMYKLELSWIESMILGNIINENSKRQNCRYCGNSLSINSISRHEQKCKMKT